MCHKLTTMQQVPIAKPDIRWESRFWPTPPAFDAPIRRGSRPNIAMPFGVEKLEWLGYTTVKKLLVLTQSTNVTDMQIDARTVRHRMTTLGRACIASCSTCNRPTEIGMFRPARHSAVSSLCCCCVCCRSSWLTIAASAAGTAAAAAAAGSAAVMRGTQWLTLLTETFTVHNAATTYD